MKPEDIKLQLQILFDDLASNCNDEWVSKAQCKQDAYEAYETALNLIDEMYSSITRDNGRTLKLFEVED
jgi:hypothetical protein